MDSSEREELSRLIHEQERLQNELSGLSGRLRELEERLGQSSVEPQEEAEVLELSPEKEEKYVIPKPILGKVFPEGQPAVSEHAAEPAVEAPPEAVVRSTPPPIPEAALAQSSAPAQPTPKQPAVVAVEVGPRSEGIRKIEEPQPNPVGAHLKTDDVEKTDWELNLGRVWFVRAGVGLLLTGLVFLSLYAYQNWIFGSPPGVKVSFFFVASMAMVLGGLYLEKRREDLLQYGQVLSAGGLAAGYYTLYAAHFVPALKVITSPIGAAVLLTLWAAGMLIYAAWRKGRVLAVMSIGLAYYATVVNPSGWISLFSSLVLSASAMILLIRYRWVWVGAVGLGAAYLSHVFWLSLMGQGVAEHVRVFYLSCNWMLFAVATQVPQAQKLSQEWRRALLGINNTAFWALLVFKFPSFFPNGHFVLTIPKLYPHEHIGWISILLGLTWLVVALLTRLRGGWRREYVMLWGAQGLLIATLGMMIEASGYWRFMMLACEACILLVAARQIAPRWTRLAAILCYVLSLIFALLEGMTMMGEMPPWQGYLFASLFGFAFVSLLRWDVEQTKQEEMLSFYGNHHRVAPFAFAWTPWAVLIGGCILRWEPQWALPGLCGAPLLCAGSYLLFRRRESLDAAVMSAFALAVTGYWLIAQEQDGPSWAYAMALLFSSAYWLISDPMRKRFKVTEEFPGLTRSAWMEGIAAVVIGLILLRWFCAVELTERTWLIAAPFTAIAGTVVFLLTRRVSLAFVLGFFHCGALFVLWFISDGQNGWVCAMPFVLMFLHQLIVEQYFNPQQQQQVRPIAGAALILALAGLFFVKEWNEPILLLALWATLWLGFSFWRKDSVAAVTGSLIPLLILSAASMLTESRDDWSAYWFLPVLPASALLARRLGQRSQSSWSRYHVVAGFSGILMLGFKLSMHVLESFDGNGLAICWGLFAMLLFAVGLFLVDRLFRRFGLFFLMIALIHILLIDVMRLDTLGRILSFLTLGAVLLLLGFLYNRFQNKIRKYL